MTSVTGVSPHVPAHMPPTFGTAIGGVVGATVQPASSNPASATRRMAVTTADTVAPCRGGALALPSARVRRGHYGPACILDRCRSAVLRAPRLESRVARRKGQGPGRGQVQ